MPFLKKKYGPMNTPFTSHQASRRRGNNIPTNISIGSATVTASELSTSITGAITLGENGDDDIALIFCRV